MASALWLHECFSLQHLTLGIQHNVATGDSGRHFRGSVRNRPDTQSIQRRRSKDSGMIAFQLLFVKVLSEAPQLSYGNQTKQRSEFSLLCSVFFLYQPTSLVQTWWNQRVYRWHQRYVSSQGKGYFSWSVSTKIMSLTQPQFCCLILSSNQLQVRMLLPFFHSIFSLVFRNFLKKFVYADF